VIDEVFGIFITLASAPKRPWYWLLGYLVFLILDGLKPFPISWLDTHLQGGLGIMLDDMVAGIYASLFLHLMTYLSARRRQ
jgi:phosphatidylglycerophosphatase A